MRYLSILFVWLFLSAMSVSFAVENVAVHANLLIDQGISQVRQSQYQKAADLFQEACRISESSESQCNLGMALTHLRKFAEAKTHLLRAISLDKTNSVAWEDLAALYTETADFKDAADSYQKYLDLEPKDPNASAVRSLIASLRQQAKDAQPKDGPDYFSSLQNRQFWPTDKMPITVFISSGAGLKEYQNEFTDSLHTAFDEWSKASDGKVNFNFVGVNDKPGIIVKWTDNPKNVRDPAEGGDAHISFCDDKLTHVDITLLTVSDSPLQILTMPARKAFFLHEIGHAVGLDHSPNENDIMYGFIEPERTSEPAVSTRDGLTLQKLYSMAQK
jgi:predicted Zn-dependent protease